MLSSIKEDESLDLDKLFEKSSNPHQNSVQISTILTETVTMTTPDFAKAPILEGSTNYEAWNTWITVQCLMRGVNAVLQGKSITPVADEGEAPAALGVRTRTHAKKLEFIERLIFGSCKDGPRALIASENDPIKKFELLKKAYQRCGYTAREVCWRKLTRSSIDDFKNSSEYGQHLKQAAGELKAMGFNCEKCSEWQLSTTFLHGLGAEYDTYVSLMLSNLKKDNTGNDVELEFDDVFRQIDDVDQRRKLSQGDDSTKGLKANKAYSHAISQHARTHQQEEDSASVFADSSNARRWVH